MKYKVGDKVRVRRDLRHGERIPFGVTVDMEEMAGAIVTISEAIEGSPDKYRLEEDSCGYGWCEQMFEWAEQFASGGIVPVLEQIDSETIKIIDRFNKEMRYRWDGCKWNEIGTKKRTGIESRKYIRKRLLKL